MCQPHVRVTAGSWRATVTTRGNCRSLPQPASRRPEIAGRPEGNGRAAGLGAPDAEESTRSTDSPLAGQPGGSDNRGSGPTGCRSAGRRRPVGSGWEELQKVLAPTFPGVRETVGLVLGFAALLWLTFRVRAWLREDDARADHSVDLLTDMRELHREGGLSDEEFRLIRTRLVAAAGGGTDSLRRNAGVVPPANAGATTGTATTGPEIRSAPSLQGRSDRPGPEVTGLPDGQS